MLPLLWYFFANLLILEYPDHHQTLISSSLYYPGPRHKISSQSVHNILSNVVHKQTNRQTDKQTIRQTNATKNITSFAKEVITVICTAVLYLILSRKKPDETALHINSDNTCHSLKISGLYNLLARDWKTMLLQSHLLLWRIQKYAHFTTDIANHYKSTFSKPPFIHHCYESRDSVEWEVTPHFYTWSSVGMELQTLWPWVLNVPPSRPHARTNKLTVEIATAGMFKLWLNTLPLCDQISTFKVNTCTNTMVWT